MSTLRTSATGRTSTSAGRRTSGWPGWTCRTPPPGTPRRSQKVRTVPIRQYENFRMSRGIRNPGVRQCLGFSTSEFWSSSAYESAEQKPKHCLTTGFLIPLKMRQTIKVATTPVAPVGNFRVGLDFLMSCVSSSFYGTATLMTGRLRQALCKVFNPDRYSKSLSQP